MDEEARVDRGEHVRLVLRRVGRARDEPQPVPLDQPRVVPRPEGVRARALRERHERREPERAVAAHAGVWREAGDVTLDERLHHGPAEGVAEVEGDMRQAECVTGLARSDHGVRGAARALGARPCWVEPQAQGDADRVGPLPGAAPRRCRPRRSSRRRSGRAPARRGRRTRARRRRRLRPASRRGQPPPRGVSGRRATAPSPARRPRRSARRPRRGARRRTPRHGPSRRSPPRPSTQASHPTDGRPRPEACGHLQLPPGALPCP